MLYAVLFNAQDTDTSGVVLAYKKQKWGNYQYVWNKVNQIQTGKSGSLWYGATTSIEILQNILILYNIYQAVINLILPFKKTHNANDKSFKFCVDSLRSALLWTT